MNWKDLFRKKRMPEPVTEYRLADLKVGYFVDYDMQTWEVTAHHHYDWGSGDVSHEWQLKGVQETLYLEHDADDEDNWSISRKIPFKRLDAAVRQHLMNQEEPPESIVLDGMTFFLEESAAGYFHKDSHAAPQALMAWSYTDDTQSRFLTIEQWGETDFEAALGEAVAEYQFSNILPGGPP